MFARYIALSTFRVECAAWSESTWHIWYFSFTHKRAGERFATPKPELSPFVVLLHTFFSRFSCIFFLLKCSTASGTANCNAVVQIRALTPSRRLTVNSRGTLNSRSMLARRRRSIWWRLMAKKSVKTKYFHWCFINKFCQWMKGSLSRRVDGERTTKNVSHKLF